MERLDITSSARTPHSRGWASPPASSWQGIEPPTVGDPVAREGRLGGNLWADIESSDELTRMLFLVAHPVVVAFEDRDCAHCRAQRAMLSLAWHQLAWQVSTLRVDGRRLPNVADRYRILGYPTLLVFSAGRVVDRLPGRRDARSIIARLSRFAGPADAREDGAAPAVLRLTQATTDASIGAR